MDFYYWPTPELGKFDSISVIVDRLTKSVHFAPMRTKYNAKKFDKIYTRQIV